MRRLAVLLLVGALAGVLALAGGRGDDGDGRGLLAVEDAAGSITTIRPDGTGRAEVSGPATAAGRHTQAAWSPGGGLIAWAEVGAERSAIHVANPDGSDRRSGETPFPPFYLAWSPDGTRIVALGSAEGGIGVLVATVAEDGLEVDSIEGGQPFYLDWSPGGERLLAHVGADLLVEIDPGTGMRTAVPDVTPGGFQAPMWLADGRRVFAERGAVRQAVVLETPDGARDRIVAFDGYVTFDLAAGRIAFESAGGDPGVAVTAAVGAQPVPALPGVLTVLDLESGRSTTVSPDPVLAFEWSPDGTRLLYLTPLGDDGRMQWNVWDGQSSQTFVAFTPSPVYLQDYLPFFDQYSRSHTAWAPSSGSFAYAGTDGGGRPGVWVQHLTDASPVHVAPGEMVSWSRGA
jgi:TolB protein